MQTAADLEQPLPGIGPSALMRRIRERPAVAFGAAVLLVLVFIALFAPWLQTADPQAIAPAQRLRPPSVAHWFGTDMVGRDIFSRTLYGARVSLLIGFGVAAIASLLGLIVGAAAGYTRFLDGLVMRIVDGLMAIPPVMLAIALVALTRPGLGNIVIAITVSELPRVVRLVRGVVLSLRAQAFIEAAIASGTHGAAMLWRHILPNALAPLLVQATYICASAMLTEAALSFIGAGAPPSTPSWGNMMAEGRTVFQISQTTVLFPGLFLSLTVLAINLLGDGLRDVFDPRMKHL